MFDLYGMYTIPGTIPLSIGVIDGPIKSYSGMIFLILGKLCVCAKGQVC